MQLQARRDTAPELQLRRQMHAAGLRYRVNLRVPGMSRRTIDVAFTRVKVAVMVHGCFWHRCPAHATQPTANAAWWREKIDRNVQRDDETRRHLELYGWEVVEVWEHEDSAQAAARVRAVVAARRPL